jgi:hypothetical protein
MEIPMSQDNGFNRQSAELRVLSNEDLDVVAGANTMDIIVKAALPALTKECLYRLTRQGTVIICPKGLQ